MRLINNFLQYVKKPEIYKFTIVGICSAIFTMIMTVVLTSFLGIFYALSVSISIEMAIVWTFFVHEKWTFVQVIKTASMKIRFIKFHLMSITGLGVNEIVLVILTEKAKLLYTYSEFIAILITFVFNYFVHKKISWKN